MKHHGKKSIKLLQQYFKTWITIVVKTALSNYIQTSVQRNPIYRRIGYLRVQGSNIISNK